MREWIDGQAHYARGNQTGVCLIVYIEWGEIFAALKEIGYSGELVFEDGRGEDPEQWTRLTAAFPQAFVRKYGQPSGKSR